MIPLTRSADVSTVPSHFFAGGKDEYEFKLLSETREILSDPDKKRIWSSKWRAWGDIALKKLLEKEAYNKCAYCETKFREGYYGDVEHFRPKSTYWWLAYCYHNYLYSCALCNQTHKRAKFVINGTPWLPPVIDSTSTDQDLRSLIGTFCPEPAIDNDPASNYSQFLLNDQAENSQLINPYINDFSGQFAYYFDDQARIVEILAHPNASDTDLINNTIEILGLNREVLIEDRYNILYSYRLCRETYDEVLALGTSSLIDLLEITLATYLVNHAQYSGMCNFFHDSIALGDSSIYKPINDDYLEYIS